MTPLTPSRGFAPFFCEKKFIFYLTNYILLDIITKLISAIADIMAA